MDVTLVIATVLVLLIALFIVLIKQSVKLSDKRTQDRLLNELQQYEQRTKNKLSTYNIYGTSAIGITTGNDYLIYARENDDAEIELRDLSTSAIRSAEVLYDSYGKGYTNEIRAGWDLSDIILRLHLKTNDRYDIQFYNEIRDGAAHRYNNTELAKKWQKIVSDNLN